MQNDALESNDDLESLFDLLHSRNKKPMITANFLTANPDFERIESDNFNTYYNENLEALAEVLLMFNYNKIQSAFFEKKL
jgi:collagenase-like PrtC family protease